MTDIVFEKKDLAAIKKYRAAACWVVAVRLVMIAIIGWLNFARVSVPGIVPSVLLVLSVVLAIFFLISIYLLAQNLKMRAWLWTLALLIPFVNLIIFVYLVVKATQVLRKHDAGLTASN